MQISIKNKNVCICPVCANNHQIINSPENSSKINNNINVNNNTYSAAIKNDKNNNSENKMVSSLVIPIVSNQQTLKKINSSNDTLDGLKRYSSYGDVILELKQKFSNNNFSKTIII